MPPSLHPSPLPDSVRRDPRKAAEVRVYDALAASLPPEYAGYHGVAWLAKQPGGEARDGEADFVIAHPERGVLVLEVKGGQEIRYEAEPGKWYSLNQQGEWKTIKDPFDQARINKYALLSKLKELPALKGKRLPMSHGVWFPGVLKAQVPLRPDAPGEIIIDRADLDDPGPRIEAIFDHFIGDNGSCQPLGPSGMDAVRNLLARDVTLRTPLGRLLAEEEREMLTLTEAQFDLLDFLSRNRKAAIVGGAGTGKTLLALEKARRLAGEGFRTLLTCFNIPLEMHLQKNAGDEENLSVKRFHQLCYDAATAQGLPVEPMDPDQRSSEYWTDTLPGLLSQAIAQGLEKIDAIVVDEAQDLTDAYWLGLHECLADPDRSVFYVFLDEHQNLFTTDSGLLADFPTFPLSANLRNTRKIHYLAQQFSQGHSLIPQGPEGRAPEIIVLTEGTDFARELGRVLHRFINEENVPPDDIAILLARRPEAVGLPREGALGAFQVTGALHPTIGKVTLDTIHRFKGMEAPVVILTGLEGMHPAAAQTLLYVGITRAKGHLVVLEKVEVLKQWGLG